MSKVTTVAVDLGKEVFQIGFADRHGREVRKQRRLTSRDEFRAFVAEVDPRCEVLMEVGWGAQGWARAFRARNIRVRLLPARAAAQAPSLNGCTQSGSVAPSVLPKAVRGHGLASNHRQRTGHSEISVQMKRRRRLDPILE